MGLTVRIHFYVWRVAVAQVTRFAASRLGSTAAPSFEKPIVHRLFNPPLAIAYRFLVQHLFYPYNHPESAKDNLVWESGRKSGEVLE